MLPFFAVGLFYSPENSFLLMVCWKKNNNSAQKPKNRKGSCSYLKILPWFHKFVLVRLADGWATDLVPGDISQNVVMLNASCSRNNRVSLHYRRSVREVCKTCRRKKKRERMKRIHNEKINRQNHDRRSPEPKASSEHKWGKFRLRQGSLW